MAKKHKMTQRQAKLGPPLYSRLIDADAKIRNQAIGQLRILLNETAAFSYAECLKIWKALYFGLWMADKPFVQQNLAVHLCKLHRPLPWNTKMDWIRAFFSTIRREWPMIDHIRINKFLLLLRIFQAEILACLAEKHWDLQAIQDLNACLTVSDGPLYCSQVMEAVGVTLQYCAAFVTELQSTLTDVSVAPNEKSMHLLLQPFIQLAQFSDQESIVEVIHTKIFKALTTKELSLQSLSQFLFLAAADKSTLQSNRIHLYQTIENISKNFSVLSLNHDQTSDLRTENMITPVGSMSKNCLENSKQNICNSESKRPISGSKKNCKKICNSSTVQMSKPKGNINIKLLSPLTKNKSATKLLKCHYPFLFSYKTMKIKRMAVKYGVAISLAKQRMTEVPSISHTRSTLNGCQKNQNLKRFVSFDLERSQIRMFHRSKPATAILNGPSFLLLSKERHDPVDELPAPSIDHLLSRSPSPSIIRRVK